MHPLTASLDEIEELVKTTTESAEMVLFGIKRRYAHAYKLNRDALAAKAIDCSKDEGGFCQMMHFFDASVEPWIRGSTKEDKEKLDKLYSQLSAARREGNKTQCVEILGEIFRTDVKMEVPEAKRLHKSAFDDFTFIVLA